MLTLVYPFTTSENYTYDSTKLEISEGKVRLKNLTPLNETFFASYNTDINGNRGLGILTGTSRNGASISGGKLDCKIYGKMVDYNALGNGNSQQQGCIRFQWIPNFSGTGNKHNLICITKQHNDTKNWIQVAQGSNGQMSIYILDKDGVIIVSQLLNVLSTVQGQQYEIELNWDITLGQTRLFIDGVQCGITMTGIGVRDSNIGIIRVGSDFNQNANSYSEFDNIQVFSTVQHTENYSPSPVIEYLYSITNPSIIPNSPIYTDDLLEFMSTISISSNDLVKFVLSIDNVYKYWTGSTWENSSGYAQSNTENEIITNLNSLDLSTGVTLLPVAYLHSFDGSTTPELDLIALGYDFFSPSPSDPLTCEIWGYINNVLNEDVPDVKITAKLKQSKDKTTSEHIISPRVVSVTSNSNGYFKLDLIRSNEFVLSGKYIFTFEYSNGEIVRYNDVVIPNESYKNFWDLV